MLRKLCVLVFVICFFTPGCALLNKTHKKKLFTNTTKTENVENWQWKVKDGKTKPELKKGGIDVDIQFEQVELKGIVYLSQEISDIIQTVQNPLIDSPSFTKNSLEMTTLINDGQKIYVGGLMENSTNKKIRKIPLLGDIPYLGKMFRSEDINKTKTELILLLSVEILFNEKDFEKQRLKFVRKI